jgi:hypothetical protein
MCATRNQCDVPQHFYRPTSGRSLNWYIRLVPPAELKERAGVKEFRQSTGTADLRKAKTVGARLIAEKRQEWERQLQQLGAVPRSTCLTADLIRHVCAQRAYHWLRLDDMARFEGAGYSEASERALAQLCDVTDRTMQTVVRRGPASKEWGDVLDLLDDWCSSLGLSFDRKDPRYPELIRAYADAERRAVAMLRQRFEGEAIATPPRPLGPAPVLSAMIEPYTAYKAKKAGPKHLGTTVGIWKALVAHLGDLPIDAVTGKELYGFLEARMHASHRPWSMAYAHGVVRGTLREVFDLAKTLGHLNGPNPDEDLALPPLLTKEEEAARKRPRRPYSDAQLTRIFCSDWYDPNSTEFLGKMRTDLGARYWVPLISLFHGTRVREALQLVAADVEVIDELPVLHIRTEVGAEGAALLDKVGAARKVKNDTTRRTVPMHPALVRLGLVAYAQFRRHEAGTDGLLFPSSLPKAGGKAPMLGRSYEQAFLRFVRDKLAFGHGYGNHSFRHQLEDRIRDAQSPGREWPAGLGQAYTGRKRVRQSDKLDMPEQGSERHYGRGYAPKTMLAYVETLDFSGVSLPPPYADWLPYESKQLNNTQ